MQTKELLIMISKMKSTRIILISLLFSIPLTIFIFGKFGTLKNDSQIELITVERDIALKYLSIYHQIQQVTVNESFYAIDKADKKINIKSLIGDNKKIMLWFSIESCQSCYSRELELLKFHMSNSENENKILVFVSGLENNRTFQYYIKEQNIDNYIYSINKSFLSSNPMTNNNIPFISVIDSNLLLNNIILLDKFIPNEITIKSIEAILENM